MFNSNRSVRWIIGLALFLLPSVATACLWDRDTIRMERSRFPSTLELITGKFLRHSTEFYQWRIENRLKRLEQDPNNLALLDDLAVAYDKTNQQQQAIAIGLRADRLQPNRYETLANLGTFYIHAGQYQEGLTYIKRAIEINPDAHFGREKYQQYLVEYLMQRRANDPQRLPLATVYVENRTSERQIGDTFVDFVRIKEGVGLDKPFDRPAAIKGILGIMKFGKHDSPIILEALASCLADTNSIPENDAKLLAARAYLKASLAANSPDAQKQYRRMAELVIQMQEMSKTIEEIEKPLMVEIAEAEAWYKTLHEREQKWIQEGLDPEAEFDKLYATEPQLSNPIESIDREIAYQLGTEVIAVRAVIALVILFCGFMVTLYLGWRLYKWYVKAI